MFQVTEWFPGALTEVVIWSDDAPHAWDIALQMARNYADALDAKVDAAFLENDPGMYAHARVKLNGAILAEYAVQES